MGGDPETHRQTDSEHRYCCNQDQSRQNVKRKLPKSERDLTATTKREVSVRTLVLRSDRTPDARPESPWAPQPRTEIPVTDPASCRVVCHGLGLFPGVVVPVRTGPVVTVPGHTGHRRLLGRHVPDVPRPNVPGFRRPDLRRRIFS